MSILKEYKSVSDIPNESEMRDISKEMFMAISKQHTSPAIAANQIGIDKRVIALVIQEPIYLINPEIIEQDQIFVYLEAHASFPNQLFTTVRYASIVVKADNLKEPVRFGLQPSDYDKLFKDGKLNMMLIQHPNIMQCCYIQQTIDTLNGILPEQRKPITTHPLRKTNEPGRNQVVTLVKDGQLMKIKYKKSNEFLNNGWSIKK